MHIFVKFSSFEVSERIQVSGEKFEKNFFYGNCEKKRKVLIKNYYNKNHHIIKQDELCHH